MLGIRLRSIGLRSFIYFGLFVDAFTVMSFTQIIIITRCQDFSLHNLSRNFLVLLFLFYKHGSSIFQDSTPVFGKTNYCEV